MPDIDLRSLERSHQSGDQRATELLIRAYERAGDQEALCSLGWHAVEVGFPPEILGTVYCRGCGRVPVPWVRKMTVMEYWMRRGLAIYLTSSMDETITLQLGRSEARLDL